MPPEHLAEGEYYHIEGTLAEYESTFGWEPGTTLTKIATMQNAHPTEPVRVLDYGCGANMALRDLYKANKRTRIPIELAGIGAGDPRSKNERAYDRRNGIMFIDQKHPSFVPKPGHYDLIMAQYAFLDMYHPLAVLRKLYYALRTGGELHIDLSTEILMEKFFEDTKDRHRFVQGRKDAQDLIQNLRTRGIDIQTSAYSMSIKKTSAPLTFPEIQYKKPLTPEGHGMYRFVRDDGRREGEVKNG